MRPIEMAVVYTTRDFKIEKNEFDLINPFVMENVTLKFPNMKRMLDFIRAACIGCYDLSTAMKTLTSDLSEAEINLALAYDATIVKANEANHRT